jgi:AcrR family transcriptional regulator
MTDDSPRRRPKGDKRDRTRAALLAAARDVIRERGYARTTLEDVAARAGMTTGAIYGNFRNRAELFIALADAYWPPIRPRVAPDASTSEAMRALATATIEALPERAMAAVGRLSGLAYSLEHPELRQQVQDVTAAHFELGAAWLDTLTDSQDLPMPAEHLVRVVHALIEGLVLQRLLTPDLYPDEVFHAAFSVFGAARKANTPG